MLTVSELYIYPIKSLGGIALNAATLTDRGFAYDRRWMLVDGAHRFLSQRELPAMALLQVEIDPQGLIVRHKDRPGEPTLQIPFDASSSSATIHTPSFPIEQPPADPCIVTVWDDTCIGRWVSDAADTWFTKMLGIPCRLVYMPDETRRQVEQPYAQNGEITSFSDGYPLLIIGQASLDELNSRLENPLGMDRFRPNIVFRGGRPFQEDGMETFQIAGVNFFGVKPCARCVITTTDQRTAEKGKEPLRTLSRYRQQNKKIYFGQNLLFEGTGRITVGDTIVYSLH